MSIMETSRKSGVVAVRCASCGDISHITDRQLRRMLHEGRSHRCRLCRVVAVKPPTQAHYRYWLDRFTTDEIVEMGRAIWG